MVHLVFLKFLVHRFVGSYGPNRSRNIVGKGGMPDYVFNVHLHATKYAGNRMFVTIGWSGSMLIHKFLKIEALRDRF